MKVTIFLLGVLLVTPVSFAGEQAAALIVQDQPYTWLFYYDTPFGVNNRVQGTRIDTLSPYQEPWAWHIVE